MTFTTTNGTGTGLAVILIDTQDELPLYANTLSEARPPGTYTVKWEAEAEIDPDCEIFCEQWLPGNYTVHAGMHCLSLFLFIKKRAVIVLIEICNGQCGSGHPHTKLYQRAVTSFNITRSDVIKN